MKKHFIGLLFLGLAFISCQNKGSEGNSTSDSTASVQEQSSGNEVRGKYSIKSGIVVYKTRIMDMDAKQTLSFDEYGKLELSEMEMEMMGVKVQTATLTRDGFMYQLDMTKKTGIKMPANPMSSANMDFENLSEEMKKDMNLKKEGTEDFLGRSCDRMRMDYTRMQMKGDFLVYKGIALKINTTVGTMKMDLTAESFEENPAVPAEKFVVPEGFTITENK